MRNEPDANAPRVNRSAGFTLIEILIVIVILGVLAGIAVFAFGSLTDTSEKNACKTEAETFRDAAQAYRAGHSNNLPGNHGSAPTGATQWSDAADDMNAAQLLSSDHSGVKYIAQTHPTQPNWTYSVADGTVDTTAC